MRTWEIERSWAAMVVNAWPRPGRISSWTKAARHVGQVLGLGLGGAGGRSDDAMVVDHAIIFHPAPRSARRIGAPR